MNVDYETIISDLADALKLIRYEAQQAPQMAFTLDFVGRVADNALKQLNIAYIIKEAA